MEARRRAYGRMARASIFYGTDAKRWTWQRTLKTGLSGLALCLLAAWFGATIMIAWASRDLPNPDKLIERQVAQSTKIFDRTGTHVLYEVFADKKRTLIELTDMPEYAKWATIVVEDKNFYTHTGVAWLSIARAFVSNATGRKIGGGGASTLTQQLVKNAVLTNEHSYIRKIKEAILAKQIERKFTKDQILKMYFNEIPYGSANYGVEAASQSYFGKSAKDLTVGEAATLAALPQAPTRYLNNQDQLKGRRNFVIDKLLEAVKITQEQAEAGKKEELKINPTNTPLIAPHFVLYVKEQLTEKYGEKTVEEGGLKVITTLDWDKQKIAEEEIKAAAEKNETKYKATNEALLAMDTKTGQILAMVGSRDFFDKKIDGQVNVTVMQRQPGSSFKPIVYATAFSQGLTPETKLYDVNTVFKTDTKDYEPKNYDGREHGVVSIRQALAGSLNIPAVKTLYLTGIDNVLNQATAMGYTTLGDKSRFGLSLVLGGAEVSLLEHVHGFAVLAREGSNIPYASILEVKDQNNNVLEKWSDPPATDVLDKQAARKVISIMSDNNARSFVFGANSPLVLPDRPVAAKTGTTNDWHDGWTLGFTPQLVAGVWAGNNRGEFLAKGADGVLVAAPIWHNFMVRALKNQPIMAFTPPDPPASETKPFLLGYGLGDITLEVNKANGKIATPSTPLEMVEQRTYRQPHNELFYLNKDDLTGSPPADPSLDPQFATWEAGVQNWAVKMGIFADPIPTEYDTSGTIDQQFINLVAPSNNQTLEQRDLNIKIQTTDNRQLKSVSFLFDGQVLKTLKDQPYEFNTFLWNTPKGFHTIKVRAFDTNNNYSEVIAEINLTAEPAPPSLYFTSPAESSNIQASRFPISVTVGFHRPIDIKKATIYLMKEGDTPSVFAKITDPSLPSSILSWSERPQPGHYQFTSAIETKDTANYAGGELNVEVK